MNSKRVLYLVIGILFFLIFIVTFKVVTNSRIYIDEFAYSVLVDGIRNPFVTLVMKFFTNFSNTITIILIAIILFLVINDKKVALLIPINLGLITIINQLLKYLFKRPRPVGFRLIDIGGYSFPSGHAMISTAFYGLLIYIIYNRVKNYKLRVLLIILNLIVIFMVGVSRIYLGVHFCSDVIVGMSISVIYLILFVNFINRYCKFHKIT